MFRRKMEEQETLHCTFMADSIHWQTSPLLLLKHCLQRGSWGGFWGRSCIGHWGVHTHFGFFLDSEQLSCGESQKVWAKSLISPNPTSSEARGPRLVADVNCRRKEIRPQGHWHGIGCLPFANDWTTKCQGTCTDHEISWGVQACVQDWA